MTDVTDRRESILDRLFEVLLTVEGVVDAFRNRAELETDKRPCVVLLDADEEVSVKQLSDARGNRGISVSMITLRPQIFVLLQDQKPKNLTVGQDLNMFRARIIKKIWEDAELKALITANGIIEYGGCLTDLQTGGTVQGEMQLRVYFSYPLKLSEL